MLAIPESISDGGRIDLVPVAASHIQELYEAIVESKDELSPWMEWLHPDYSLADAERWAMNCRKAWEADSMFGFTIIENQTGQREGAASELRAICIAMERSGTGSEVLALSRGSLPKRPAC